MVLARARRLAILAAPPWFRSRRGLARS